MIRASVTSQQGLDIPLPVRLEVVKALAPVSDLAAGLGKQDARVVEWVGRFLRWPRAPSDSSHPASLGLLPIHRAALGAALTVGQAP